MYRPIDHKLNFDLSLTRGKQSVIILITQIAIQ